MLKLNKFCKIGNEKMRHEFMYSYDVKTQANSRITLSLNKRKRIKILCSTKQAVYILKWYKVLHIIC